MLSQKFRPESMESDPKRPAYDLTCVRDDNWSQSRRRVLIITQNVHPLDLKAKQMMGSKMTHTSMVNAIKYARKVARPYADNGLSDHAFAVVNGNAWKHMDLRGGYRKAAEQAFAARAHDLIKKLKPTHVLVAGDDLYHAMYPDIPHPQYKRGWIRVQRNSDTSSDWKGYRHTNTVDFYRLIDGEGELANMLGFFCRHLAWLMLGQNPHDLSRVKSNPYYVDTIDKVDKLFARLDTADIVAFDTEDRNLSVLHNKLYTIQFAMEEDKGYVLTVDHPLGHWSKEERLYIKKKLHRFFSRRYKVPKTLITFNGMFDLRVIRQCLKIPIIWHRVWEIMAGEHDLDENYTHLHKSTSFKDANGKASKFGGLAPILSSYCNDHYYTAEFGKEDRMNIAATNPKSKAFLKYASMDAQALVAMRTEQIRRASFMTVGGINYKKPFMRHVIWQMSDTAHVLSHLKSDGSKVDRKYLKVLKSSESPLVTELLKAEREFRLHKEVRQANTELLSAAGIKSKGLFKRSVSAASSWIFKLSKSDHKRKLFLEILGLEEVNKTKTGEPAIDKAFIARWKDKNKIISLYGAYQALSKLLSTYVKGWYRILANTHDAATDDHLRPDYSFTAVDTGRLASMKPNLQQIPSRGPLAKLIKKMFIAPRGTLLIRYDYSAHEVRMWSVVAGDTALASVFRVGQKLRQAFIADPSDANKAAIKKDGDVHIINVKRFFNKVVDKDHPLRDAVKAVVFGVIYGKGPDTLGEDTKKGDMDALKKKLSDAYEESLKCTDAKRLAELKVAMDEADNKLTALMAEDRKEYAQGIMDKLFGEFKKGARWIERMAEYAETEYHVYSPIYRRRFLPAAMVGDRGIVSRQVRRGSNAPIQGFASEIGVAASRAVLESYYEHLSEFKRMYGLEDMSDWDLRVQVSRIVHDANYFAVPYALVIPFIHILQHEATYGVTARIKERFGVDFTIEPEIEVEVAARDDLSRKWSWALPELVEHLHSGIADAQTFGVLEGSVEDVTKAVLRPWKSANSRSYLQEHFPLLGVKDLEKQIKAAAATPPPMPKAA